MVSLLVLRVMQVQMMNYFQLQILNSGLPPRRLPQPVPISTPSPTFSTLSMSESIDTEPFEELSKLTIDDIEDFDDDDDLDEVDSQRYSRRVLDDAIDLVLGLSSFATAIGDDLCETKYEILLAAIGASRYFRLFCFLACNISHPIN
ncbi:hypothetical protein H5410_031647 [Solanum commersonii]|uniref:Uncharacterized protein n=1 Tax=Solanum commersonii TaxID=4109 RepID=A0A9J5YJS5_SOLCO|nr:hypothetical protein H5410_031647 [Solanum commersonii]